ncbi:MAG: hypothetical protein KatS3mg131_2667 [Candidatus Tectimicrobiota bacterium]|nr:MAG: hypothetical protein KatS3mg131_2667 [Candidatus Tectomicrobia bacterium]
MGRGRDGGVTPQGKGTVGPLQGRGLTRRHFCRAVTGLAALGCWHSTVVRRIHAAARSPADRTPSATPLAALHRPVLRVPATTRNGAHVPIVVEMDHPMHPDHYVASVHLRNDSDPIPSKGIFHFTPANGRVYLAVQARMHSGTSTVQAVAVCTQHGRWVEQRAITIPEGAGGCATAAPAAAAAPSALHPPVLRIPALVARRPIHQGDIIHVQVKIKHPSHTGLAFRDGTFVQVSPPFYLEEMRVFYGERLVSRYEMTPAISDNPFITFALRVTEAAPVRVVFTNNHGQQFEAVTSLGLS